MAELRHPAASHELPSFITAPGETEALMVVMSLFLVLVVVMFGILFLRLHTLPERMAHKSDCRCFRPYRALYAYAYLLDCRPAAGDDRSA
jgi:hypothetical protein